MTYTPLPGSIADRAIGHICQLPKGTEIAAAPLAEAIECDRSSIPACLTAAVAAGILAVRKHERLSYYSKGNGKPLHPPVEPDEEDEAGAAAGRPEHTFTQRKVQANGAEPLAVPPAARSVFDGHGALASMQGVAAKARPTPAAKARPVGKGTRVYTARKGKPAATRAAPTPAAPKVKAQRVPFAMAVAPAPIAPATIAPPPPSPPLACALFNTGELVIEAPDQPALRLTRPQARELVNYLQHIEAALQQST